MGQSSFIYTEHEKLHADEIIGLQACKEAPLDLATCFKAGTWATNPFPYIWPCLEITFKCKETAGYGLIPANGYIWLCPYSCWGDHRLTSALLGCQQQKQAEGRFLHLPWFTSVILVNLGFVCSSRLVTFTAVVSSPAQKNSLDCCNTLSQFDPVTIVSYSGSCMQLMVVALLHYMA